MTDGFFKAFKWSFAGTGLITLLVVAWFWTDTARFASVAVRDSGTVVDFEPPLGTVTRAVYYPIIAFRPAGGAEVRFKHNAGSRPPSYQVGERVPVWYDPARPVRARMVHSWWSLYGLLLLFVGVGLLFVGLGLWAVPAMARLGSQGRRPATGDR